MAINWDSLVLGPSMKVFGEEVVYTPRGGQPIPIPDAVWDEASTETHIVDGEEVVIQTPMLGIRAAALNGIEAAQSDRVTITATGSAYVVARPLPDGHGHILLKLMKAQP